MLLGKVVFRWMFTFTPIYISSTTPSPLDRYPLVNHWIDILWLKSHSDECVWILADAGIHSSTPILQLGRILSFSTYSMKSLDYPLFLLLIRNVNIQAGLHYLAHKLKRKIQYLCFQRKAPNSRIPPSQGLKPFFLPLKIFLKFFRIIVIYDCLFGYWNIFKIPQNLFNSCIWMLTPYIHLH